MHSSPSYICIFSFHDTATTQIYTLSLHDALPISPAPPELRQTSDGSLPAPGAELPNLFKNGVPVQELAAIRLREAERSEEHTSELQSLTNLVCRLLLEKKKKHTKSRVQ